MTLDQLSDLEKAATSGPWHFEYTPLGPCGQMAYSEMIYSQCRYPPVKIARRPGYDSGGPRTEIENAAFIAAMRNHARALIDVAVAAKAYKEAVEFDGQPSHEEYAPLVAALSRLDEVQK